MLSQRDSNNIRQEKLNALVAIQLHQYSIRNLQRRNQLIEFLTIAVPVFFLVPRLLAKGMFLANFVDGFGEILAAALLVLAILKLAYKWQDKEVLHSTLSRRNLDIVYEADRILGNKTASHETVEQFLNRTKDMNAEDENILSNTRRNDKQTAYREALKKFDRNRVSTPCPICGADPWKFSPGVCQACGGTPA